MFGVPTFTDGVLRDYSRAIPARRDHAKTPQRFKDIEARADAALDSYPLTAKLTDELQDARAARANYLERIAGMTPDPAELARLDGDVERAERALRKASETTGPLVSIGRAWKARRDECLGFLNRNRSKTLVPVPVDVPKGSDVNSLASKLGDLDVARQEAEQAPMPEADALERVRSMVEAEAARGAPRASLDPEAVGNPLRPVERIVLNIHWPSQPLAAQPLHGDDLMSTFDSAAAFCWAHRDAILAKLEADVRNFYKGWSGPVFTDPERRQRIAELRAERLVIERQLAAAIWARIDSDDNSAVFPDGLSPEAVLGVAVE